MKYPHIYPFVAALLAAYKASGKPFGVDAHLRIVQLMESLPEKTYINDLKTLIAPIIVGSPQQQDDFYTVFDRTLAYFDFENTPSVSEQKKWKKWAKWAILLLVLLVLGFWMKAILTPKPPPVLESIFRHIVDIEKDSDGKKEKIDSFLVLPFFSKPLFIKTLSIQKQNKYVAKSRTDAKSHESLKTSLTAQNHLVLTVDSLQKTLFYKPISVGEDTFNLRFCLSNDTCYEQIHVFSVQKVTFGDSTIPSDSDGSLLEKTHDHKPPLSSLIIVPHTEYSFKNAYMSGRKWAAWGLSALVIWLLGFCAQQFFKQKEQQKQAEQEAAKLERKPNVAPPFVYQIRIKDVEKVNFDAIFSRIMAQLRHRSEIEQQIFDPKRTVKATILRGGLATFRYRQPTRADEYLFLIDMHNANDHRAQVFDLLYRTLARNEVLIERFFYDGDLRLCWNETYRNGIKINELAHRLGSSRLVIVGTAASLIDGSTGNAVGWLSVFDAWRQRALLTPRAPSEWKASERVLATKFRVLPANLKGMAALAETLEAVDPPDFRRWRSIVNPDFEAIHLPDQLSATAIWSNLEAEFTRYKNGKADDRLLQWLAACAVSPILHWDATLFFGQLIDVLTPKIIGETPLTNLDNLFRINRLTWFVEGKMPESARRALLDFLEKKYPSVLIAVRTAWNAVLQENLNAAQKAAEESGGDFSTSVAFDELRLQMIVNDLKSGSVPEGERKNRLNELRGLSRGGKKGDFIALEILQNEAEKEGQLKNNDFESLKQILHKRIENGEIDPVINELLTLTKTNKALQDRLKNMKLALRK